MNIGGTATVKDATIHLVEARALERLRSGQGRPEVRRPARWASSSRSPKGPIIYHAGDTDVFAGMALIAERYHPTVALLPIGGHFTMDPAGAALAAKMLKVKTVVPMHFGTFPILKGTPDELTAALKKQKVVGEGHGVPQRHQSDSEVAARPAQMFAASISHGG